MTTMTPEEVVQIIRTEGLTTLPGHANPNPVLEEFDKLINSVEDGSANVLIGGALQRNDGYHNTGKFVNVQADSYSHTPKTAAVFNNQFFKDIVSQFYGGTANFMLQMYFGYDYNVLEKKDWPRNSHLHFDPFQAIKFMLLLTDCSKENGTFRYIPGSQRYGKKCREGHNINTLLSSSAYTFEANPSPDYSEDDMVYCVGKPGDILIFDTDTLHGGGIVLEEGLERKSIIAHNRSQ